MTNEAKAVVSNTTTPHGQLRIGVIESLGTYLLPNILEPFMFQYPQVELWVRTATTREILSMLKKSEIDLMLTLDEPIYDPELLCVARKKEDITYLCSSKHSFSQKTSVSLNELMNENLIFTERLCNYRHSFERICEKNSLSPHSSLEIGCTKTILDFTAKGLGVTFLPQLTATDSLNEGKLIAFDVPDARISMEIQLFHRKDQWFSPAMREFTKTTVDYLSLLS